MTKAVDEALSERYGELVFRNRIGKSVAASNSTAEHTALREDSKIGRQYAELSKELIERCG